MQKKLYDHRGNVARVLHSDPLDDDYFSIETFEDVEPIIDTVKNLRDDLVHHRNSDAGWTHVAVVPMHVVEKSMREGWFNDEREWDKWSNEPQNKDFRVYEGRV